MVQRVSRGNTTTACRSIVIIVRALSVVVVGVVVVGGGRVGVAGSRQIFDHGYICARLALQRAAIESPSSSLTRFELPMVPYPKPNSGLVSLAAWKPLREIYVVSAGRADSKQVFCSTKLPLYAYIPSPQVGGTLQSTESTALQHASTRLISAKAANALRWSIRVLILVRSLFTTQASTRSSRRQVYTAVDSKKRRSHLSRWPRPSPPRVGGLPSPGDSAPPPRIPTRQRQRLEAW